MSTTKLYCVSLVAINIFVLLIVGWGLNIYKVTISPLEPLTTMVIVRIIGIFLAPLGGILGWF